MQKLFQPPLKNSIFIIAFLLIPREAISRNVFLNGIDISGAVSHDLKNVDLMISERGDIYISAPNYHVYQESEQRPLSSKTPSSKPLIHKPIQQLSRPTGAIPDDLSTGSVNDPASPPSPEILNRQRMPNSFDQPFLENPEPTASQTPENEAAPATSASTPNPSIKRGEKKL